MKGKISSFPDINISARNYRKRTMKRKIFTFFRHQQQVTKLPKSNNELKIFHFFQTSTSVHETTENEHWNEKFSLFSDINNRSRNYRNRKMKLKFFTLSRRQHQCRKLPKMKNETEKFHVLPISTPVLLTVSCSRLQLNSIIFSDIRTQHLIQTQGLLTYCQQSCTNTPLFWSPVSTRFSLCPLTKLFWLSVTKSHSNNFRRLPFLKKEGPSLSSCSRALPDC
jgi:hypothetical protein